MSGGLDGPYTHWYPDGTVESHGNYTIVGSASVPDGIWGFWYQNGSPKRGGRYAQGKPVGCFAMWDENGVETTGMADGDRIREARCSPPSDATLLVVEARSNPLGAREIWGDVALHGLGQVGAFGARNEMQQAPDPRARGTIQAVFRKHLGRFRVGPEFAFRLSDSSDARAYAAGAVGAYAFRLPYRRLGVELEAQLGVQYLDLTARRSDIPGTAELGFWSPMLGARAEVSFSLVSNVSVVAGLGIDGTLLRKSDQLVTYCSPFCRPPVMETWTLGGAAYGADLGLRLLIQ